MEGVGAGGGHWEAPQLLEWEELEAIPGPDGDGFLIKWEVLPAWSGFASRGNSCPKFWKLKGRQEVFGSWEGMGGSTGRIFGVDF